MKRILLPLLVAGALPAADSGVGAAINAFTVDSYQRLDRGETNLVLSPFNIAAALSMALAGARGQTAAEMESVLHFRNVPSYDAGMASLLSGLAKSGNTGDNQLLTANALWVQKGFAIEPGFEKTLTDNYQAPPTPADFQANAEAVRQRINAWTEEHTRQKIQDLFPAGSLNARTRLVLTSAIYFYGQWQEPFVPSNTQPAPFHLPGGGTAQTNFMNQTTHFGYTETSGAQILEMRYTDTGIAFDVLLPKTADGLPELEKSLSPEKLTGWLGSLASRNVRVALPKFRAESEFSLPAALSAMGMPMAFTSGADFTGISARGGLCISEVVHKAFVDVSERGTEAAAATGIGVHAAAMVRREPPVVFQADHPFLFLIRDARAGTVLFIGRLTGPR